MASCFLLGRRIELRQLQACRPIFPLQITVDAPSLQRTDAVHLIRLIQHALDDSNEFSAHHLRLRLSEMSALHNTANASDDWEGKYYGFRPETHDFYEAGSLQDDALLVRLVQDEKAITAFATLEGKSGILHVLYSPNQIPSVSSSSSSFASFVAEQLRNLFEEEQAIIAQTLTNAQLAASSGSQGSLNGQLSSLASRDSRMRSSLSFRQELAERLAGRLTRSLKYAPEYHITISLFSPTSRPSAWQIEEAIADTLVPLLDPLSRISNFSVDTQIQLHAAFAPTVQAPAFDDEAGVWTLRTEDLSGFINAAEWPLSPSIAAGPTINFILYVPDPSNTPLVIKESGATSWLIPQWGGIVILNPETDANTTLVPDELSVQALRPAFLTFGHQLLSSLGAPQHPQSLPLQLQTLTRIQAASLLLSASSTMGSLARLTKALPTIAIPETVSAAVDTTLAELRKTCDALKDGNFDQALEHARVAEIQAEKGFFEKSMVGQVYFPDEHKVAVYLPLLGPIGVPLVMSAVKELKRILHTWRAKRHIT